MKIYVSHRRGMKNQDLFYKSLQGNRYHDFVLPHLTSQEAYPSKELFQNKECDLVLAEVSEPSTGQGIELGWANAYGLKIICISQDNASSANSLKLICDTHIKYSDLNDLGSKLEEALK
jgi:hypothetical protein